MVLALLAQIIREPLFKQLRTVEQLGYAIHSGSRVWTASVGLYFSIQSERDPSHTEARLHAFLRDMADQLRDLPDKEFQQHRAALIEGLEEKLQNLDEERSRFWSEISSGYNDFHNGEPNRLFRTVYIMITYILQINSMPIVFARSISMTLLRYSRPLSIPTP